MQTEIVQVCDALDTLSSAILRAYNNDNTLVEALGWHSPALTRHDLALLPSQLADEIRTADLNVTDDNLLSLICDMPRRIQLLQTHTLPQMFNGGNAPQALSAYSATIGYLRFFFFPLFAAQSFNRLLKLTTA